MSTNAQKTPFQLQLEELVRLGIDDYYPKGGSQKYFTHEVPKSDSDFIRYSMTLREHLN